LIAPTVAAVIPFEKGEDSRMAKRQGPGQPGREPADDFRENLVKTRIGGDLSSFMKGDPDP